MRSPALASQILWGLFVLLPQTEGFLSCRVGAGPSTTSARFVLQEKLSSEEIHSRLESQLAKLREKDRASKALSPDVRVHDRVSADRITSNVTLWAGLISRLNSS
jgi:hypothetical protein